MNNRLETLVPIDFRIDSDRRVVFAAGRGTVTPEEVFDYQRQVWSRADVAGYNELFDMSAAERIIPRRGAVCATWRVPPP